MKKITDGEFLYKLAIILMVVRTIISNSKFEDYLEKIDLILIGFIVMLLLTKITKQKYKIKEFVFIAVCGLISLYVSIVTKKYVIVMSYFAFLSLKGVEIERLIKIIFRTTSISLLIITICYFLNLLFFPRSIDINIYYKGMPRHAFYMNHPNFFAGMIFWCMCEYLYLNRNRINIKLFIKICIVALIIYNFTKSRTMLISTFALIFLMFLYKIDNKHINRFIKWFSKYGFFILTIFFIILVQYYSIFINNFYKYIEIIDNMLSKRLSIGVAIENIYGFSILPQQVNYDMIINLENSRIKFALDNIYLNCAIVYGLIESFVIGIIFYLGNKTNNKIVNYLSVIMLINGITESYILNFVIVFPMLLLGNEILNKGQKEKDEKRIDINNNTCL